MGDKPTIHELEKMIESGEPPTILPDGSVVIEYLKKTKEIISLLDPTHYSNEMWAVALEMNLKEIEELEKTSREIKFIAKYVRSKKR